ncbi:glycosyltransferase [Pseudoalteromonas sp. SWYJ118]|uniref:glycosyltransferase n=1 Tax=Pseudoalteromonas sp. SWYJ118 TaxID=2792062 RepID=UPI0018CCC427|nr:glycosyltransferase [Pseudoalteromonas sp. SWYJ118]MBH0077830.1 glycosyltransferase [Pseudoalteromonas sp. SWYJ118]
MNIKKCSIIGKKNIIHIISSLGEGGAEGVLFRLCKHDTKNKHIVITLTSEAKYSLMLRNENIEVIHLNMPTGRLRLSGLFFLYRLLRKKKPCVVQTWMYHSDLIGGVIARLAGIRNVIWNIRHSSLEPSKTKKSTLYVAKLSAQLSSWIPKKIICCAEEAKVAHVNLGYDSSKFDIIGNGYDLSHFKPQLVKETIRETFNISSSIPLLGMVGRYTPEKDQSNLFGAISKLVSKGVPLYLVLAGHGMSSDNNELVELIDKFDISEQVILMGSVNDIPNFMNQLDLHILSSSSEGFPNVLAEAMACSIPCVTTDAGSAKHILGDCGWITPIKDTAALSNNILLALQEFEHKNKWETRKASCVSRIRDNFSIEAMVDRYTIAWDSIEINSEQKN